VMVGVLRFAGTGVAVPAPVPTSLTSRTGIQPDPVERLPVSIDT
jgi:hypothetical protein